MRDPTSAHRLAADPDAGEGGRHSIAPLGGVLKRNPRDMLAGTVLVLAAGMIALNALYLQRGPHPAPIFAAKTKPGTTREPTGSVVVVLPRPRPVDPIAAKLDATPAQRRKTEITAQAQRELERRGFYEGPVDGILGSKTDAAIRDFEQAAGLKQTGEASEELLRAIGRSSVKAPPPALATAPPWAQRNPPPAPGRADVIAQIIAPAPKRVIAVQRALTDFGYGQIKPNGMLGSDTVAAIEKFEHDRKLPITGQVTDRLLRELSAMSGRPLE